MIFGGFWDIYDFMSNIKILLYCCYYNNNIIDNNNCFEKKNVYGIYEVN